VKDLLRHKALAMTLRYTNIASGHKLHVIELLGVATYLKPTV